MNKILLSVFALFCLKTAINAQCATSSAPTNNCTYGDQINSFSLGGVASIGNGGCGVSGYNTFATPVRTLAIGSTINWDATVGSAMYNQGVAIWIDLNNNNIFEATEMVASSAPAQTHNSSFTMPSGTPNVNLKMRVRCAYTTTMVGADACTNNIGSYGETEDYNVYLVCPPIAVNSGAICVGQSFTMMPTGADTYTYSSGSAIVTPTVNSSYTVTGTSTLTGCTNTAVSTVTVNALPVLTTTVTNVLCNGGATGAVTLTATGGASPYMYSASNGATVSAQSSLSPGVYTYTVTDNNSCVALNSFTVTQPSAITQSITSTNVLCNGGSTGAVTLTVNGGTTPYNYVASNGSASSMQTTLSQGVYTYTVTDSNSCTSTTTFTITEPSAINLSASANNTVVCAGDASTLTAMATGGTGTQTYTWVAGSTANTNVVNPTITSTYTVNASDASNCASTATVEVTVNALPTISVSNASVCIGQTVTLNAISSGAAVNWYASPTSTNVLASGNSYSLSPVSSSTVYAQSTNYSASTSTVGLLDNSGGGNQQTSTNYNIFDALTNFTLTSVEVYPGSTGNAVIDLRDNIGTLLTSTTVAITSTVGPVTIPVNFAISTGTGYQLGQGAGSISLFRNSSGVSYPYTLPGVVSITNSAAGSSFYYFFYKWTVSTLNASCSSNMAAVEVTVNTLPTISVNSGSICDGQSFTMTPSGATTYTYSNGSSVATPTANATYSVSGTDANGCVSNVDAVSSVTVNALPTVSAVTNNTLLCTGETATLTVSGTATSYTWSTTENTMNIAVSPTVQTTYTVDGTDANGCMNTTTIMQDVSLCTGFATIANTTAAINLYPNPTTGMFTVELTTESKIVVTNALGQIFVSETFEAGKHNLDIRNEATGVYFVKVIENNKQQIIKVVKQ